MQAFSFRKFRWLFAAFAIAWAGTAAGARNPEPVYTDNRDGLPQNSVRTVRVDRNNFVWVGTERGLARFDGHRFVNFSERDGRVPVDVLIALFEDRQGRLWSNWYNNNPRVLSPDRGNVIEVLPRAGEPDDLRERPYGLYEDRYGVTWFNGLHSIYWMETDGRVDAVAMPVDAAPRGVGSGDFFYAGIGDALYYVDVRERPPVVRTLELPGPPAPQPAGFRQSARFEPWRDRALVCAGRAVYAVGAPADGAELVYVTDRAGIINCRVQGDHLYVSEQEPGAGAITLKRIELDSGSITDLPDGLPRDGFVASVFSDSRGGEWAVVSDHLYRRAEGRSAFERIELRAPVFGNMQTVAESHGGEFWIATDGAGLARIARDRARFSTYAPPDVPGRVTAPQVRRIASDGRDRIWLGTEGRGINRWDRARDEWRRYLPDGRYTFRQVAVTRDGTAWGCSTQDPKLWRFDEAADRWTVARELPDPRCALRALADGDLLVATMPALLRRSAETGAFRRLNRDGLPAQARGMAVDAEGAVWMGIHGHGLLTVSPDGSVRKRNRDNSGLSSDQLFALAFDRSGRLWIGSWHGGLQRFDPRSERFETWNRDHGLPDNTVFGVLIDDEDTLWLSTYRGLVHFEPCDEPGCRPGVRVFNRYDGLQGDEFDAEAFHRAEDGELFFGGGGGFNAFYPRDIRLNTTPPRAAITLATVDGRPLPGADSPFEAPAQSRLPHNFGELRIELSSLDYNAPEKNRYQYRIGPDGPWLDLDGPELVLRGLPEGEQSLAFRGSNNDGAWSNNALGIELAVMPPPWRHPAMLVLYGAILLFAPVIHYGRRQSRMLAARRELEAQVAARTRELEQASSARERFFANISHEIAAPLHMILLLLEQRRDAEPETGADAALYRSASGYAAQLLAYLRQLVEGARSFEADSQPYRADIVMLVNSLVILNRAVATGRHIALTVGPLAPAEVKSYRHSVRVILSNLLCNALTYTPEGGEIRLDGERAYGRYRLSVSNTLHPDHPLDLEEAMQRGARGSFDATAFGGHGLGLSIVTESVQSLGGEVRRRIDGERVCFDVFLPLADASLPPLPETPDMRLNREQKLAIETLDAGAGRTTRGGRNGPRVLVVEDDDNVSRAMAELLEDEFRVTVAHNANEGVEQARKLVPDIVLCDLFLPDASGITVLEAVRGNRMTMNCLFIMITASVSETDRETAVRLGVDHFLRKPVSAATVRSVIHNHQALAHQRDRQRRADELRQRARADQAAADPERFEKALDEALEELYPDASTTVEDLQLRLAMGYSALNRRCRERFGKTPKRLLLEKRIERASARLRETSWKVGVIAELSGFSSHAQFASAFKRLTGMSPGQYRNQARRQRRGDSKSA